MGLLDEISKLTTPAAELPDLEDDNFDESSKTKLKSQGARKFANFDFEKDAKYAGKSVSRAELFGDISEISGLQKKKSSNSDFESDAEDEDEDEEEEEEGSENEAEAMKGGDEDDDSDAIEEGEEQDVDDEEEEEDNEEEEGDVAEKLQMKLMSLRDDSDKTADKAEAVRNQKQVWDDLMYANIRMHALLNSVNQMPRGDARKQLVKSADEKTMSSLQNALENMAKLRNTLQKATDCYGKSAKEEDDDDEEIPSDDEIIPSDDEEMKDEDDEEPEEEEEKPEKSNGTSVKTLKSNLEKRDVALDKFRGTTITKWYNRTKLLSAKSTDFSAFEKGSILGQIQKVLADEDKLLKKVRTNRNGMTRLGSAPSADGVDNEIFDDSDFYQVLLKQMLEARSQNSHQDGADMTRNYMELQTMFNNKKKKRDVSQLSSKDRRLKYEPIAKLINFYPSKPSVVTWSHESRNELFKSLFT